MKSTKSHPRLSTRSSVRTVSLQIRVNQVTVKVKSTVPQARPQLWR